MGNITRNTREIMSSVNERCKQTNCSCSLREGSYVTLDNDDPEWVLTFYNAQILFRNLASNQSAAALTGCLMTLGFPMSRERCYMMSICIPLALHEVGWRRWIAMRRVLKFNSISYILSCKIFLGKNESFFMPIINFDIIIRLHTQTAHSLFTVKNIA